MKNGEVTVLIPIFNGYTCSIMCDTSGGPCTEREIRCFMGRPHPHMAPSKREGAGAGALQPSTVGEREGNF
jgi:hypothetical protein